MPVVARGKNIIERSTGRVVAHSKSKKKAKKAASMRNMMHAVKKGDVSYASVKRYFGE